MSISFGKNEGGMDVTVGIEHVLGNELGKLVDVKSAQNGIAKVDLRERQIINHPLKTLSLSFAIPFRRGRPALRPDKSHVRGQKYTQHDFPFETQKTIQTATVTKLNVCLSCK